MSQTDAETPSADALVECPICRLDIRTGAKKCVHCDSYLDFRKHLNFSASTLSLLIALFSVGALFVSQVDSVVTTPGQPDGLVAHATPQHLQIIASNAGETPVAVTEAFLTAPTENGSYLNVRYVPDLEGKSYTGVLDPEGFKAISLKFGTAAVENAPPTHDGQSYFDTTWVFTMFYKTYEGDHGYVTVSRDRTRSDDYFATFSAHAQGVGAVLKMP